MFNNPDCDKLTIEAVKQVIDIDVNGCVLFWNISDFTI